MQLQEIAQWNNEAMARELTGLLADLAGAITLRLYDSPFVPSEDSVLADFTAAESAYSGYAAVTITFSAVAQDSDQGYVSVSSSAFFQRTAGAVNSLIAGAWIQAAGPPAVLVRFFHFSTPIPMSVVGQFIQAVAYLRYPNVGEIRVEN